MNRPTPANESVPPASPAVPSAFHPEIRHWFAQRFPAPTDIQSRAWPPIAQGEHVLITAPTGSGKTLTAFLWAINQLLTKSWPVGTTQALYISPLKALNNDIQRNLIEPLSDLKQHFESKQLPFPEIRIQTRSGDTGPSERQRMIRKPPEILITTPESLNLLLSTRNAAATLKQVKTVILDEIHALVESKRGVFLMSAVERLSLAAGEFQRIALSATVNPLETVAQFVAGREIRGSLEGEPSYLPRPIQVIRSRTAKIYDFSSCYPDEAVDAAPDESIWTPVAKECKRRIANNRSTLIFTNNRALCEKITLLINSGEPELIAYAHHGSLSREIRLEVEQRLKAGQLKAIVATNSLELGIDIGDLDEVLLIQCPSSVASTLQRLGRAGHRIGQVSKGCLITTHARDFLESSAMLEAVEERAIEAAQPIHCPLDLLPQIIVSMVATSRWTRTSVYNAIRTCASYDTLSESHFDLVLNMMMGRFTETRIHELRPLIGIDSETKQITLRQGTLQRLYLNSGVIPNRGYYHLRTTDSQARIGELDEEYVWEAAVGQTLTLGTQHWKIDRITHNDVFVSPANPKAPGIPFWRADDLNRSFHFSERIADFLETANEKVREKDFEQQLQQHTRLDTNTGTALTRFLKDQQNHTEANLPHRHHLLIEVTTTGPGAVPGNQVIIHTLWGGKVNRPYAMAIGAAWQQRFQSPIEIHPGNDCIALVLPQDLDSESLLGLVTTDNVEQLLRQQLESSGFFAARFRECAGRALLVSKRKFNERLPLWMSRLRSQKLFEAVSNYDNFPITLETWRTCLHDEFDLPNLIARLSEIESGELTWTEARTHQPSPMARSVAWRQVNEYMYRPDAPGSQSRSPSLGDSLVQELLNNDSLRPQIPSAIIRDFEHKRRRLAKGYTPDSASELSEWLKERILISEAEWQALLAGISEDHQLEPSSLLSSIRSQVCRRSMEDSPLVFHRSLWTDLRSAMWPNSSFLIETLDQDFQWIRNPDLTDPESSQQEEGPTLTPLILEWMKFSGPITRSQLADQLGIPSPMMTSTIETLIAETHLVSGHLEEGVEDLQICDSANLETLLRMKRRAARPHFEALPPEQLQHFLARYQGLTPHGFSRQESLSDRLNQLLFLPATCPLWESEILPARCPSFSTKEWDLELHDSNLLWMGTGKEEIQFAYEDELHLGTSPRSEGTETSSDQQQLLPEPDQAYSFTDLLDAHQIPASQLSDQLWENTWAGHLSNDRFATLRQGILNRFSVTSLAPNPSTKRNRFTSRPSRSTISKWRGSRPTQGQWFALPTVLPSEEGIEQEEIKKDRVRLLIDRYGILFRELLWKERSPFTWREIFRTLRLMEFSGEIVSGHFFKDIPGPQFVPQSTVRHLQSIHTKPSLFWMNAADPISLCGLPLPGLRPGFPKRLTSNHVVFRGPDLILVSERIGKRLTIQLPPEDPDLPAALGFLKHLLCRSFQPISRITIETINEIPAASSPYLEILRSQFELILEPGRISIYRPVPN